MNMRVAHSGGWFVASSQPSPSNQPANDPKLQDFLGRINSELRKLSLPVIDVSSLQKAESSYRNQAESLYGDDVKYLPEALFTLMAIHDTLSRRGDLNLNFLLRKIEGEIKTLRQQGAQNALMNEYQLTSHEIPLADAEPMLRERRIKEYLNNNSKLLNELATALQAIDPTLTEEQAKEDATERLQSHIKEEGFPGYHSMYKGWRIDVKEVRAHIRQEITRISNAAVTRRPTDPGLVDVVYPDFGSLLEALKLNGYQHLETQLSFPVVVRLPNGTEIGATLILRPEAQSRAGVVVSFEGPDQVMTHDGQTFSIPGPVVLNIIPRTVHLENQRNTENLITVGSITWDIETAGEQGRQFLEALNTPGAIVTLTVPRGFLDTPRDLGPQMDSLVTYNWANPDDHRLDMARTAMNWVKSQPGGNRDLLRIIAEEIYQGYRGQENGQDNAIEAVRNFLVSVAEIENFDDTTELDTVTGRSRVLDAVYHSLIEVARTDPRLLVAWLELISAVDATNQQGRHVGRAVRTEQGEVVEGGYNLQAGIGTIAALAELTNYPEVLAVLKNQLSGLLKANRALEHERYLVLSHKALGKLLPGLDLEGVNLFHADLNGANLSGANLQNANLQNADLQNANLSGANLTNANLQNADLQNANLGGAILSSANLRYANLQVTNLNDANLSGANLSGANLFEANLTNANLSGANLSGANLQNANLSGVTLNGTVLEGANLTNANLNRANLSNANLSGAHLTGAVLSGANLFEANLRGANLRGANLSEANLRGANLSRVNLSFTNLAGADLTGADLTGANLTRVNLNGLNLNGVILTGAIMTRQTLEKIKSLISEHGYTVSGLETVILIESNAQLDGSDLSGVYLYQAYLSRANLQNASLQETILTEADLSSANLQGTNLTGAYLISADLSSANLRYANLQGTNLNDTNLQNADLRGANLTRAYLRGANVTGADFRGATGLSPQQIQYIRSRSGILDQPQPPTSEHRLLPDPPGDNEIPAQPTNPVRRISDLLDNLLPHSPAGPTERAVRSLPNKPTPGLVIGGNTIPTPEENLQLLRDLGIDPTGIRPDLLDDPTLKNLLREFRHTGDKEKARAKIAEWLRLKGVDRTPLALPPHTGDGEKQRDPEIPTNPPPFPDLTKVPDSRLPVPKEQPADPPLTQALSNLKNSVDPARLMREWSEAGDPQLKALLTFEGLQQVLAYGLEGKLLEGLSEHNLSRFLSAYNTENVLSRIINDPEVSSTVKASARKMLSSVKNVLNEARLAPFKSALAELERRPPEDRTALILGWAKERDPRLLLLLGTEQGLRLVLDAGMGGSFLTALAQGYSGWLRHLNTANLLQKLAQENPGTPLGTAAQNLLTRVNNVLRAATTPPQRAAERTDNLPLASKVEQPNLIKPITPSALDSSVQALRQAKTPEQRLEALNGVRTTLQELLNLMTMNPNEQLQGISLMQQQFVGLIIEKLQEALKWVNDPQREKDAAYIAQGTWEFAVSGLSALAASIGFLWSLRPGGTS